MKVIIKLPSPKFLYDEEMGELHDPGDYAPSDCVVLYTADQVREAVRLNATVPDGWKLVPVQATPDMCKAAVIYANGNAVYKNVAHEALEIEESIYSEVYDAMLSASPAAPQPPQPLTDEQIKRIMLDNGFTIKEGLTDLKPYVYAAARALIAAATGVKND